MKFAKPTAALAISATMAATAANAGALVDPIVEADVIVEEASSSSSAGILIPLLLLIIIGVALTRGGEATPG
ncbi:hypothetical protein [Aliiroseovarius subalbicans]|uniref:hypothetical protein n=1 Tax=Aliiroseovarius subalbicans TaxID=2925840 RepID=UPI001F570AAE|nr:hypothetical protein [Aliiroseovarius subalbicans]MCI2398751.1 hypothetical protein [Aliiroseovarius subalbicans]